MRSGLLLGWLGRQRLGWVVEVWPLPNPLDLFGDVASGVTGWAWEKVIQGVYTWFANGLLLLMEWVWGVLDSASTPRLTEDWFRSGLVRPLAGIALGVTVAMMLASAVMAGFGGRPELVVDAIKEGPKSIAATAVTLVVMDVLIRGADVMSAVAWQAGRADAQEVMDGLAATMSSSGPLATTFLGPLALLFGMIGLLVTTVVLFMRSSLLYVVAAFSPIVWASSVSPVMRGSGRRLVHLTVALVLAKPAITVTLVVGLKLLANASPGSSASAGGEVSGAAALGTLVSGFACFAIASLSPWVIFRLLPTVEQASASSGIVGGWGRTAMTGVQAGLMVKSLGAAAAASAATRSLPQASSAATSSGSSGFTTPPRQPTAASGNAATSGAPPASRRPSTPPRETPSPTLMPSGDEDRQDVR